MSPAFKSVFFVYCLILNVPRTTIQANLTLLMDIVNCADRYHHFHNIPILAGRKTLFQLQDFVVEFQNTFQRPTYILTDKSKQFFFRFHIYRQSLVLVFFRDMTDAVFEMTDTFTRGRRLMSVLFVLLEPQATYHEIREIMVHVWANKYMHAILLYCDTHGRDHLITFEVYPAFKIKSLTDKYRVTDIFAMRSSGNLKGYKIMSPVKNDLPRVSRVTDYSGHIQIKGYAYQLFMAFVKYRNATFVEYVGGSTSENALTKDFVDLISAGDIEISLHPFGMRDLMMVGSSYPIRLNDVCIMIPMANEIPGYMYLWRPFHSSAWVLLIFGIVYLTFTLMWIPSNSRHSRMDFGLSLLQSVGYMLSMPMWTCHYNVTWKYFLAHHGAWLLGFFVTTWYCALLRSFLTSTVFGPQIDTMDDLIASGLKILVAYKDIEDFRNMSHIPKEFVDLFVGASIDSVAAHRNRFNTTYAYAISIDRWNFLNLQQQFSKRPVFRLSSICFMKHHIAYLMAYDSRLLYPLNSFILYAQQSGLLDHWTREVFKHTVQEGYIKLMMDSYEVEPMHIENMRLAWEAMGIGLGVSAAVFTVEAFLFAKRCRHLWIYLATKWRNAVQYMKNKHFVAVIK